MISDWQLPPGTDRGLWDYIHNNELARSYDERLAGTPLLEVDIHFARRHFQAPGSLIDLGCGTGRLLLPLARLGFNCLGVDLSGSMLEITAAKARNEGLKIACLKANLVELNAIMSASFDYAACLFSTLGMIRGRENRRSFLGHVFRILRPGGLFVIHVHNRWFGFGRKLGKRGTERGDRVMPQAYGGAALTLHHYTRAEIRKDLRGAGFECRQIKPIDLSTSCELKYEWLFRALRAYGYLVAAVKPRGS